MSLLTKNETEPQRESAASPAIDHVVIGVSDLNTGVNQLEDLTSLQAEFGGKHPHLGTENALLSLGPRQYLEVLAPAPGAKLDSSVSFLSSLQKLTPVSWVISTANVEWMAQLLKARGYETTPPRPGSRLRPDGARLDWKTLTIKMPPMDMAPVFIAWNTKSVHPANSAPTGCTLSGVELTDPHAADLQKLVDLLKLSITVRSGTHASMKVMVNCPKGKIVIGE